MAESRRKASSKVTLRLFAAFFIALACAPLVLQPGMLEAQSSAPVVSTKFTVSSAGVTPWVPLSGQAQCAVVVTGSATFSTTVEGSSDSPPSSAITVTSIGSAGVITAAGTYSGGIARWGLTGIRLNTASITGSATMTVTCSTSSGGANSQSLVTLTGSITATGTTAWLPLSGQTACTVVLAGTGTGMTIVPEGASDQPPSTAVTISNIGSGSMSANGAYPSTTGISQFALTGIRLNITGFSAGTETYTIACSNAQTGTTTGTVTIPTPLPVVVPTSAIGGAIPVIPYCPSGAPGVSSGAYPCKINSSGQLSVTIDAQGLSPIVVNTPAPAPTGTTGAVATEPHAYTVLATANPTSTPLPVKTGAGTLGGAQMWNGSGGTLYIGFYDALVANVTLGTTAPKKVLACPATTFCFLPIPAGGVAFGTAITYLCGTAITGGVPTTGCGSITTTFLSIDYYYRTPGVCDWSATARRREPFALVMKRARFCARLGG